MTTRIHGGNITEAARQYGIPEKDILDFSASINPLGPPPSARRAARKALRSLARYPDPALTELRAAIGRYHGIKSVHIVCGHGMSDLLHLIPRVFRPKKVLIPVPAFTEYAAAVEQSGGEVVSLALKEQDGFRVDPVEMAFALKGADMAILGNPSNPTGRLIPKAEMQELLSYARKENVRLVVDESFMEFTDAAPLVKEASETSSLICLRTFTTFFGMPGLRIGYAVTDQETAGRISAGQTPWAVTIPAQQAAMAALTDWRYIKKSRKLIERERERLLGELRLLPGVEPFPGFANFILIKLAEIDSHSLTRALGLRGVLIRDCSTFPGLDNRYVRIAVKTRRQNEKLLRSLREFLIRPHA